MKTLSKNPWVRRAQIRAIRKQEISHRASMQGKLSKAMRIIQCKGKNGHSMNAALLAQHGIKAKGEPTA
jgi:hypothetical protein